MDIDQQIQEVAAAYLADPTDAAVFVNPATVVDADGKLNQDALKGQLGNLVTVKPHLAKVEVGEIDYRTASREEFELELANRGVSLRHRSGINPYYRR